MTESHAGALIINGAGLRRAARPPQAPFALRPAGEEETQKQGAVAHRRAHRHTHMHACVYTLAHTCTARRGSQYSDTETDRQTDTWVRTQRILWPPESLVQASADLGLPDPLTGPLGPVGQMARWLSLMALWEECAVNVWSTRVLLFCAQECLVRLVWKNSSVADSGWKPLVW